MVWAVVVNWTTQRRPMPTQLTMLPLPFLPSLQGTSFIPASTYGFPHDIFVHTVQSTTGSVHGSHFALVRVVTVFMLAPICTSLGPQSIPAVHLILLKVL
jgi:hypothetical protein